MKKQAEKGKYSITYELPAYYSTYQIHTRLHDFYIQEECINNVTVLKIRWG